MYKNTQIFDLPNTIQIMTSIYFGPAHRGAFCDMAQCLLRLELSHGTICAVPHAESKSPQAIQGTALFWLPNTEPPAEDHYFFLNESS